MVVTALGFHVPEGLQEVVVELVCISNISAIAMVDIRGLLGVKRCALAAPGQLGSIADIS